MSLRDQMVALLVAQPGMTAAELREAMQAMGLNIGRGEPAVTLRVMREQGRVRYEGEMPGRRYYAVDGATAPTVGGRRPKKVVPSLFAANSVPAAKPTVDQLAPAATIERQQLRDVVLQHITDGGSWISAERIAADLGEDRQPVALAVADLMREGKLQRHAASDGRWEYQVKGAAVPALPEHASETPPVSKAPVEVSIAAETQSDERVSSNGNPAPENFALEPAAPTVGLRQFIQRALDEAPVNLPHAIGLELVAIEDILGNACDAQAPHSAIKALVAASSSLRRAQLALAAP